MLPNPTDLIALLLGILFTLRQMDVAQRASEHFPAVLPADFERWKRRAAGAYRLGSACCFGKVLLDLGFKYILDHYPVPDPVRWGVGLTLDVGWAALVLTAWLRSRKARALGREIGVERLQTG